MKTAIWERDFDIIIPVVPRSSVEIQEVLDKSSAIKQDGVNIRVSVLQSPWIYPGTNFPPEGGRITGMINDKWLKDLFAQKCEDKADLAGVEGFVRRIDGVPEDKSILVVISLGRMNAIGEISTTNLLVVAEGGVRFRELEEELREQNLFIPFRPDLKGEDITVAELIMGGEISSTEGRFGGLRESILSLELVVPGRGVIRTGARTIKNVAGYEIPGLIIGAGGRCGVVSGATLRAMPERGRRVLFAVPGTLAGLSAMAGVLREETWPVSLVLFNGNSAGIIMSKFSGEYRISPGDDGSAGGEDVLTGELSVSSREGENEIRKLLERLTGETVIFISPQSDAGDSIRSTLSFILGGQERNRGFVHISWDSPVKFDYLPPEGLTGGEVSSSDEFSDEGWRRWRRRDNPEEGNEELDWKKIIDTMPNGYVFKSLYPDRIHALVPLETLPRETGGETDNGSGAVRGDIRDRLDSLIRAVSAKGLRERMEILCIRGDGSVDRLMIPSPDKHPGYAESNNKRINLDGKASLKKLEQNIYRIFDPHDLMLR